MTERDIAERLRQLCSKADRLKMPSHRHSAESFMVDRDEIRAVVSGVRISGTADERKVRASALLAVDELFSLMKPPSED